MNGRFIIRLLAVLAIVAALAIVGVGIYQAGLAAGLAAAAAGSGAVVYPAWGWGPGFGLFGFLGLLVFLFLLFALLRAAFGGFGGRGRGWGGPGRWAAGGRWGMAHDAFEDWHRRAHQPGAGDDQPRPTTS